MKTPPRHKRLTVLLTLSLAVAVLGAADASAAVTRYAAPGGTATPAQCTDPAGPYCTIDAAASGNGVVGADEVVILPGQYSESAGDLGPQGYVNATAQKVHGVLDQPRPVIQLDGLSGATFANPYGAFFLGPVALRHVDIRTDSANSAFTMVADGGVVDGVIARNTRQEGQPATACAHWHGILRNSVCLTTGPGGIAAGANVGTGGTPNPRLRNVTAVSTGTASFGLDYFYGTFSPPTGPTVTVSAKSVIAQGTSQDARARASNTGADVTFNLDHSSFDTSTATASSGGTATITPPGTGAPNFNITAPAELADDGYHQLAGSPTINAGATDANSGTTDIDGQGRQIGLAPADIGADEAGVTSATTVECSPASLLLGATITCTATVTAPAEFINGSIDFESDTPGTFGGGGGCVVVSAPGSTQCELTYTPTQPGTHRITATYSGGAVHDRSSGSVNVTVQPRPTAVDPTTGPGATTPVAKKCKRKKAKKGATTAKKRKCKKRKRR